MPAYFEIRLHDAERAREGEAHEPDPGGDARMMTPTETQLPDPDFLPRLERDTAAEFSRLLKQTSELVVFAGALGFGIPDLRAWASGLQPPEPNPNLGSQMLSSVRDAATKGEGVFAVAEIAARCRTSCEVADAYLALLADRGVLERLAAGYRYRRPGVSRPPETKKEQAPTGSSLPVPGTGKKLNPGRSEVRKYLDKVARSPEVLAVERLDGGHFRVKLRSGSSVVVGGTPSSRGLANDKARLRGFGIYV